MNDAAFAATAGFRTSRGCTILAVSVPLLTWISFISRFFLFRRRAKKFSSCLFFSLYLKWLNTAEGLENKAIAERLQVPREVVSRWRKRFYEKRLEGLEDRPRSGRPRTFSPSGRG